MSSDSSPNKSPGRYHTMKGNIIETVGKLTGSKGLQQSGAEERRGKDTEYDVARAQGYAEGSRDRAADYEDIIASLTRDKSQQGNARQNKGQIQQELNQQA
ncbi:mismatched base pair and cruciform DNA recognition protein [Armillaria novae-zelandiae]|uniref:Mismatched base pair and cruciform DNA recognition protein n=1 Tax=Armillaria novae-zelandiae TaxID=153914 RepID=A0AA39PBH4_9AGAR|nr:mismatched base pair and cruciform DNA recognition protein [Armillaria novae-zelandiae]